ncbi:transcription-repair coupling factor [Brackiella oedipodis]|uniref:transcription-repair coupling factor n=1 Tax=Brackiella oedipodis TaxID=124225 RepID=UPI00056DD5A4|nr:transcription-repair coupling factor [Brackiella oedipodis]
MSSTLANFIASFSTRLKAGQKLQQALPPGSGDAYYLAQLQANRQGPIVIFCADPLQARRLSQEIKLFNTKAKVHLFPDWETLPYDSFSPHQDLISERLQTLHALQQHAVDILLIPVTTALYCLPPTAFLAAYTFAFKQGQRLDLEALKQQLTLANYQHVSQVARSGEFSIRGSIIDIFPMGSVLPYRLDLFDDEIDSIRSFDVDTQRSIYSVRQVDLLPGREFPLDEEARNNFRSRFRETFEGDPSKTLPYRDISQGIAFAGVEYYLPLFFEQTATIFDYLSGAYLAVTIGDLSSVISDFSQDTQNRYRFLNSDRERPVLPPEALFLTQEAFFTQLKNYPRLHLQATQASETPDHGSPLDFITSVPNIAVQRRSEHPFKALSQLLKQAKAQAQSIILCADSDGRRETLLQTMGDYGLKVNKVYDDLPELSSVTELFSISTTPLFQGFGLNDLNCLLITENELYPDSASSGQRHRRNQQENRDNIDAMVRDLSELREGDPVVHIDYGIGRYCGLVNMTVDGAEVEMLKLQYANDSTLYVPVSQLHVISRYGAGDPENAPLHTLGSGQWDKARKRAAKQVRDTAAELLSLYAHRQARAGQSMQLPMSDYQRFASEFKFEETPDQADAIKAVISDMAAPRPMDRLVCGDVGFGKTEVALRAAFIAIANGKQVALLCPTTLLAEQHAQTFRDRFADWPVKVAELSRFRASKEVTQTLQGLADGTIDIVIGTHKLLSKGTQFKRLGLVIIDEEHRFGVRQKEALKALRTEVDILTLTATPIPRTLGMSLDGIRDFSVIATAPQKRLAIKTFVRREDNSTIREAVLRELKRGGQVYFLHNEVDTIYNRQARLQELLPEARIGVAHGQLPERELEQVMKNFYQQRFNILLCTTIIETGIDVPSANTIIIHRADRLGLAQLHQLRGRVGRSHHQAYAYLLTPGEDAISSNARKRLEAIQSMEELGSGFYLAMHDLEIRGTGEILGESQSGNIHEVGFSLYTDMLNQAIRALKKGQEPDYESPFEHGCEVKLHSSALLPNDYCPDINVRLSFYKRLSHVQDNADIMAIQEEMIDRLGTLPEPAKLLLASHKIRLQAEQFDINVVDISETQAQFSFSAKPQVDPVSLIELVQSNKQVHFSGPEKIKLEYKANLSIEQRIQAVMAVLQQMRTLPSPASTATTRVN